MQLIYKNILIITSGLSAMNKKGIFWYLSHSLRCPTEGGCGDDTHCSSPIISCLKGLVSHLNDTIRHLQSVGRSTGETNYWGTKCFLCNLQSCWQVHHAHNKTLPYSQICLSSLLFSQAYSPNLSSAWISLQAHSVAWAYCAGCNMLMHQNVLDSIWKQVRKISLLVPRIGYLYSTIMWLSSWLTCDSSLMPIPD